MNYFVIFDNNVATIFNCNVRFEIFQICFRSILCYVGNNQLPSEPQREQLLNNFSGERLDGTNKEKHSGTRNRATFATVLFLFRSVTPFPRKLDQTILFLSLSHLWLFRTDLCRERIFEENSL